MKAKLHATLSLYAGQTSGSSLINYPGSPADKANEQSVRDKARKRLVRPWASPDVDAMGTNETTQKDNAAFTGKKYRIQDIKYGHIVSEHDSSASASLAEQARPYSRILRHPELHHSQVARSKAIKYTKKHNPDID